MKKNKTKTAANKNAKNFYAFGTYKPNKNAVPVEYKGTTYLSKAQCMALEGITRKELDAYLNGKDQEVNTEEKSTVEGQSSEINLEDIIL